MDEKIVNFKGAKYTKLLKDVVKTGSLDDGAYTELMRMRDVDFDGLVEGMTDAQKRCKDDSMQAVRTMIKMGMVEQVAKMLVFAETERYKHDKRWRETVETLWRDRG